MFQWLTSFFCSRRAHVVSVLLSGHLARNTLAPSWVSRFKQFLRRKSSSTLTYGTGTANVRLGIENPIRLRNRPRCGVAEMSLSSDYEHRKKLNRIREDMNKKVKDVRDHFAKIEKVKVEALKKNEDMRQSAERDMRKLEEEIARSNLTSDMKKALVSDIATLRKEIESRATELRTRISGTVIPS